jgi:protein TonB
MGGGPGGGAGSDISSVGVVDELSGGAGMYKPSLVPKPPALQEKPVPKVESKAIPLPGTLEPKRKKTDPRENAKKREPDPEYNAIPTAPEPGSGGSGGRSGGSGGGFGGGVGVSIGPGAGGFGDHWYVRSVEKRISDNWIRPQGQNVEIVFSFNILANGSITSVKLEKSSGNPYLDSQAERAIVNSNPLSSPPPEFRGRPIRFVSQFIYPPNQ